MRRIFFPSASFECTQSLYYSIRFFFSSLFYLMCFNLYIKNVNARAEAGMKFDRWRSDKYGDNVTRTSSNTVFTRAHTHNMGIPGLLWEHFFHRNHPSRLKYPTRCSFMFFFAVLSTSEDHIEQ